MIARQLSSARFRATLICLAAAWLPATVIAAEPQGLDPLNTRAVFEVFGALVAVLALIAVLAMVLRRVGTAAPRSGRVLQIVDAISISTRDRIVLVDVGGSRVLLGVTPGSIRTLHVAGAGEALSLDPEAGSGAPDGTAASGPAPAAQRGFAQHVRAALGGGLG